MEQIRLTVTNATGLHARPAALFVQTAGRFASSITVANATDGGEPVDAKSILSVLTLGANKGHWIDITAEGPDAGEAIRALEALVTGGLGE